MYGFGFLITNSDITFTIYFWAEVFLVMLAPLKIVSFVLDTKLYSKKYRLLLLCNGSWFNFHTQRSRCVILTKVSKMRDFVRKKIKHFHENFFKEIVQVQETQCGNEKNFHVIQILWFKMPKMKVFDNFNSPKLISRKFWAAEKFRIFHTILKWFLFSGIDKGGSGGAGALRLLVKI